MVPWKIVTSAESLLNFMLSLGIFLAPIIAISIADYWIVKKRRVDVPGLYQPHGLYAYNHGFNWRACIALILSIAPTMPSLVHNINPDIDIGRAVYIADLTWYYGFFSAFLVYIVTSLLVPAKDTLLSRDEIDALEVSTEMVREKVDKPDA
jgi:NCS1 family nucleobase:cation symporter-1